MSVVGTATRKWSGAGYGRTDDGRTAQDAYEVQLDTIPTNMAIVLTAAGVPRVGDEYPGDGWLICRGVGPARARGPLLYEVPVSYERRGGDGEADTPLDTAPEVTWGFVSSTEPIDFAIDGKRLANAVGEPFDPAPVQEFADLQLVVVRNELTHNIEQTLDYRNVTNTDTFLGVAAGQVLCKPITGTLQRDGTLTYYKRRFEFLFRAPAPNPDGSDGDPEEAWYRRLANEGFRTRVFAAGNPANNADGSPKYEVIKDKDGQPISEPVFLTADGKLLPEGDEPVWLTFQKYKKQPFAVLGIELT